MAAWLHDIGYSPQARRSGFHPLDGALLLQSLGAPAGVVQLVAHHTGADFEAEERSLVDEWSCLPAPPLEALDEITLVDLCTGPTGLPTAPADRVDEILARYDPDHPVGRAVRRSAPSLLASAARARARLSLPASWPL